MAAIYDDRRCELGEGPLWHPGRGQLFWFDILNGRLMSRTAEGPLAWALGEFASAAGWIDRDRLLIASETSLSVIDLATGGRETVAPFLADQPDLRSNDGRADPWGGFWIGGMGKKAERGAGGIWRLYRGELRRLFAPISIPNAISFTPDRRFAHFADSMAAKVWRVALDETDGWPAGEPSLFLDLTGGAGVPDGAVCDSGGNLWIAEWGAARVACYDGTGQFLRAAPVGGRHSSCPAFGGAAFDRLFVTSARENLDAATLAAAPENGCTFVADPGASGLPEYRVIL
ncbi:MAG: SMP-30/gluconolactonase/LRE family protein [Paracoccaceae bacterium]